MLQSSSSVYMNVPTSGATIQAMALSEATNVTARDLRSARLFFTEPTPAKPKGTTVNEMQPVHFRSG